MSPRGIERLLTNGKLRSKKACENAEKAFETKNAVADERIQNFNRQILELQNEIANES
jgi:hypothetical protein